MPSITMTASAPDRDAREVFDLLRDFERYPDACEAVLSVEVDRHAAPARSTWEVRFREGILIWTEEDRVDERALEVCFEQLEGDLEHLAGRWKVTPRRSGCEVTLSAEFDVGIPSLSDVINPLAERTLYENSVLILQGLVGGTARVLTPPPGEAVDVAAALVERTTA